MKGYLALDTNIILVDAKSIYNLGSDRHSNPTTVEVETTITTAPAKRGRPSKA